MFGEINILTKEFEGKCCMERQIKDLVTGLPLLGVCALMLKNTFSLQYEA